MIAHDLPHDGAERVAYLHGLTQSSLVELVEAFVVDQRDQAAKQRHLSLELEARRRASDKADEARADLVRSAEALKSELRGALDERDRIADAALAVADTWRNLTNNGERVNADLDRRALARLMAAGEQHRDVLEGEESDPRRAALYGGLGNLSSFDGAGFAAPGVYSPR